MNDNSKILYWLKTAESDLNTAEKLYLSDDYHWCLFIGHLVIEKMLKALFTQNICDTPPRIHDLVKLAKLAKIDLDATKITIYNRINDFNIEARYPDEKLSFYKIATKDFAENNLKTIKEEFKWLKSQII
jgi:HEPN domain-containing protein